MASTSREAPPSSPVDTPTINNSASTSATTDKNDDHARALSLSSKMIRNDLLHVDSAFSEAKKYMDHMNVEINQAHEKFEQLQALGGSQRDFDEHRKAVAKLKFQIPSHGKIRSADSNPHRRRWPNINEAVDKMTHFSFREPKPVPTGDYDRLWKAFCHLPEPLRYCLLCFFKFPPEAFVKRTTMIYLWIGQGYTSWHERHRQNYRSWEQDQRNIGLGRISWNVRQRKKYMRPEEDEGNIIYDELIAKGLIEPIYQSCSLVPDHCRMSLPVRHFSYKLAKFVGLTSNFIHPPNPENACLVNVGEAIIDCWPESFEMIKNTRSLYLGRWQSSATHHIELADAKILHELDKLNSLTFLSLRGISLITELPIVILKCNKLKILDLCACHNLEAIPNDIGLLESLTHLDMSECYFLQQMPKSLAQLSKLEVLKGFFIGDFKNNKQSCTLYDLSRLPRLRKLKIYVSVKDFHRLWDFDDLKNFQRLQNLTTSWGGCSLHGESRRQSQEEARMELLKRCPMTLPLTLQKLDLQCFPIQGLTDWLRPAEIKGLKKLYIRGGNLCDVGKSQIHQGEHWDVEILHLKYLSELKIDWSELKILFPKLIYLHQEECPKFTNFPCDDKGVWMKKLLGFHPVWACWA
ncbi:hypothetical protein Vadar_001203 [Vaccinium darrowii]|uniref:Uncharacterized protein n=1 Tax=Vaccinium darrowii TaxID=229202 RepID=A0ACB7YIK3_9ERIC|nr:hypothetical protein Vadar_001203 [Vaccinium darrowii]